MNELATASRYNIPIIQIIINNHVLGMVRQWQTLFYDKRYSQTVLADKVDFVKVAEGLGCEAIRVTKKEEVAPALEKAISLGRPVVLDVLLTKMTRYSLWYPQAHQSVMHSMQKIWLPDNNTY